MAKDSSGRDSELQKRLNSDRYMVYAVRECYASFKNIMNFLVLGDREKAYVNRYMSHFEDVFYLTNLSLNVALIVFSVLNEIFSIVDEHVEKGDVLSEFDMSALPSLTVQFVKLIEFLVSILLSRIRHIGVFIGHLKMEVGRIF